MCSRERLKHFALGHGAMVASSPNKPGRIKVLLVWASFTRSTPRVEVVARTQNIDLMRPSSSETSEALTNQIIALAADAADPIWCRHMRDADHQGGEDERRNDHL